MQDQIIIKAAVAIKNAILRNSHWHIGRHSDGTPAFDTDKLYKELGLKAVNECALWQWSAAMQMVIDQERQKQQEVDRFDITNRIDR